MQSGLPLMETSVASSPGSAASAVAAEASDELLSYCKSLPKVELHAHLNGSISDSTMMKLLKRKEGKMKDLPQAWQTTISKGQKRTLEECFQVFKIIHAVVDDTEAVAMVARDVVKEFAEDGVVYLELRSTPRTNEATGMTKTSYIDAIVKGATLAVSNLAKKMYIRLLLSVDRRQSVDEAMDTVLLAEKYSKMTDTDPGPVRVIGVDLSGNPQAGDMKNLLPVLAAAKEKNLWLAVHLSEIPARNEETLLILQGIAVDRIGHGTFLHPLVGGTEEIVQEVTRRKIPIELCLSSNLKTRTVPSIDKHHLAFWKNLDHPLVLCTDDKGVFSTSLSEEYALAAVSFGLSQKDLWKMSFQAVSYVFEDQVTKEELRKSWTD